MWIERASTAHRIAAVGLLAVVHSLAASGTSAGAAADRPTPITAYGTWNGIPVMPTLIRQYENERAAHFIDFTPLDSVEIPGHLMGRRCDVGMTLDSRLTEDDKKRPDRLQSAVIGRFVLGIAVNARSRLRTIAIDDLGKIFTRAGHVVEGRARLGAARAIEVVGRRLTDTEGMIIEDKVLHGRPFAAALIDPSATPSARMETDEQVVAALIKRPERDWVPAISTRRTTRQAGPRSGHRCRARARSRCSPRPRPLPTAVIP